MRVKSLLLASALALLLPTGEALAAPCAGFTDVQDTDFFCPSTAVIRAHFSGLFAGAAAYGMTMRYNTDGNGATFPNFVNGNFEFAGATGATWGAASTSAVLPLAVGSTYRFAIRTIRYGAGTFDLADFRCHLLVEIQNRRGASSPFDAAPQVSSSPDEL